MVRALILATLILSGAPRFVSAAEPNSVADTVQGLLEQCTGQPVQKIFCLGYIGGVAQARLLMLMKEGKTPTFEDLSRCGNAANGAQLQNFINWARKHPEKWSAPEIYGVWQAIVETWPCDPPRIAPLDRQRNPHREPAATRSRTEDFYFPKTIRFREP